jgi:hypothetical protein
MYVYKHLKCIPEDLPELLETLEDGYVIISCEYYESDKMLHLVAETKGI